MKVFRPQQLIRPDLQAHIYSNALLENVCNLKSLCKPKTKFCAVVKANAYGHGIAEVVNILKNNVDFFAVASIYEAILVAEITKNVPILIFEPLNASQPPDQVVICAKNNFHCAISSLEAADYISKILAPTSRILNLHVNVETGMGRCGIEPKLAADLITKIKNNENTKLAGVFTHFSTADEHNLEYTNRQLKIFTDFLEKNDLTNRDDIIIHSANSAATIKLPDSHFDMVRCGISMYGYYSRPMKNPPVTLTPVMKLQAPVVQLKQIPANSPVSYGKTYITKRQTTAALIPLGYADGYWRCFSNSAKMKIADRFAPVIGRVSMDQLLIDVTDIPKIEVGQMATIIDNDLNSPCGAYALADLADTICYEILTCLHAHVNRIVH